MDRTLVRPMILIVDDTFQHVDVLIETLRAEYEIKVALTGKQALAIAASNPAPDLILLDVMMPGMDGYEVCRRLKADASTCRIPVIFATARNGGINETRGLELGAVDYITKPFNLPVVKARVRAHLALYSQERLLAERVRQKTAELQQVNCRLQRERARFEWLVQKADDGYLILDEGDNVLYINPRARLYLGLPPDNDTPILATFTELVERQYHFEPMDVCASVRAQSGPQHPCYLVRPESPAAKAFWLRIDTLDTPSETTGSLIVRLRDVTGQVDSTRNRRAFTQMIQHKMRTPLTTVLVGMEYLADTAPELSADEIAELAQLAIRGTLSFHQSVEDILSYLDAPGRAKLGEEFHLSELQPIIAEISSGLEIKRATVFCPEDLADASLLLSKRAMELALWELLENAKKFHPSQDPTVGVLVSRVSSREISLQVRDDGLTVSPEHLGKFWTPFYQGEKDFTGEVPGMGLGLSTVAMLVWEVGGTCSAYNRENGPGIVIDLTLPSSGETGANDHPIISKSWGGSHAAGRRSPACSP